MNMNDLSIVNADLDFGIRQLSNDEIDLVSGGRRFGIGWLLLEIGAAIHDNWDPIQDAILETIEIHGGGWPATL